MASVQNASVFGLASSIYRSGYPMMDKPPTEVEFANNVSEIQNCIENNDYTNKHIQRAIRLANIHGGGHDQFLTGIVVNFDLTCSNKAWVEAERYTFLKFISSMSTMHRISMWDIHECCNRYVDEKELHIAKFLQAKYNCIDGKQFPEKKKEAYLKLLYNIPAGFEITAGMTTNYRCLKNIYAQRRAHRLPDWHVMCDWIESLPLGKQLICGKAIEESR